MIPRDFITAWRSEAPWVQDFQVEQDLVISRALVDIFSHPLLREALAFRGGTALYKLHLKPAARYSEDIDLVQTRPEPAGRMMEALRGVLDPWLGAPVWKQTAGRVTFVYRFSSEETPPLPLRLKVEINSREHFAVYGLTQVPFAVSSRWFEGQCEICSYELDELLGTKLRALYQRKQGRDLFDLATALEKPEVAPDRIVAAFLEYMKRGGAQGDACPVRKEHGGEATGSRVYRRHWPSAGGWFRLGHRHGGSRRIITPYRASAGRSVEGWRMTAEWIPCGSGFIEADVLRWSEGVWGKPPRRRQGKSVHIGERAVVAEVLRIDGGGSPFSYATARS